MHMTIGILTYATCESDAIDESKRILGELVEHDDPFDYYQMFKLDGSITAQIGYALKVDGGGVGLGEGAIRADSELGKTHAEGLMEATEREDMELIDDWSFRYHCNRAGQYSGSTIWLYDPDGAGIRCRRDLERVLTKYRDMYEDKDEANPHAGDDVWLVLADVHH